LEPATAEITRGPCGLADSTVYNIPRRERASARASLDKISRTVCLVFRSRLKRLKKRHDARTNRLRAGQIAASLLFELGTVDIR
jgi:hypothetical protein